MAREGPPDPEPYGRNPSCVSCHLSWSPDKQQEVLCGASPHECVSAVVCLDRPMEEEETKDYCYLSASLSSQGSAILDPFSSKREGKVENSERGAGPPRGSPDSRFTVDQDTEMP